MTTIFYNIVTNAHEAIGQLRMCLGNLLYMYIITTQAERKYTRVFMELFSARQRRRFQRGLKRKHMALLKKVAKSQERMSCFRKTCCCQNSSS
ncbi:hypothetical protein Avbf_14600 [Armadillidium vulgare]|nr:hypothetical protein Avbf_14600 [Armadillidium vulgare]